MKLLKWLEKALSFFKSLFLNGLFTLIPITATLFFFHFTYTLVDKWLTPLKKFEPEVLQAIPGSEIIITILLIMVFGAGLKFLVLAPLIHRIERIIGRIPLIRTVYSASKTVVDFFNVPDADDMQRKVILVEYPRKGIYALAFMLETSRDDYDRLINTYHTEAQEMVKIFIPSSPAPTTGYFLIVPRSQIIETTISFEEAIKAIVSCGLITPDSLKQQL